jgi:hypothetical protein
MNQGLYHARTEITPDQKEKFLQRYQQHQLGQSAAPLFCATPQIPPFPGPAAKEPLAHTSEPHSSSLQQVPIFSGNENMLLYFRTFVLSQHEMDG